MGVRFSYTITGDVSEEEQALIDTIDAHSKATKPKAARLRAKGKTGGVGLVFTVTDKDGNVIQQQTSGPIEEPSLKAALEAEIAKGSA